MTRAELVVVGGGPAGLAAARGYRDAGGAGDVVILARERHAPYRRPPLTKDYLRGELDADELPLEPEGWFETNSVRLETETAALALDPDARVVATERGELGFERCVLATGAQPSRPDLPGADDPALHTIRTPEDADGLRRLAPGERVVVIGSGFIGCEAAVSLAWRGLEVELVTDEPRPQDARLGEEVGERLAGWLTDAGVSLRLESPVAALGARGRAAELESGGRVEGSAVILCLGVEPDVALGRAAGIELDEGRYACDESGRTSARGVLAAGDAARLRNSGAGCWPGSTRPPRCPTTGRRWRRTPPSRPRPSLWRCRPRGPRSCARWPSATG